MQDLKEAHGMSLLLITHDLGVVAQMAERMVVMYSGQVVEEGNVIEIFDNPFHPYTQGLLKSMPDPNSNACSRTARLMEIPGTVPALTETIRGCKFQERCSHAFSLCREKRPELLHLNNHHKVRCWLHEHAVKREAP